MTGDDKKPERDVIEIIPIHFDIPGHEIPLSTFVRTAEQTATVIRTFNREFFGGQLQYELLVLPPEQGSFKSKLGIAVIAGWGVVWSFTESDIGKAFIKGLTNQEPAYWAELIGTDIRERIIDPTEPVEPESGLEDPNDMCRFSGAIVSEVTKSFLQNELPALEKVGVTTTRFRDAYEARNEFYRACSDTRDLRAIGFEEAPLFPIDRSDFSRLQVALPPKEDEAEEPWLTSLATLKVTSPNWDRDDRQRVWKGKDGKGRERYFRIDDENFWMLVKEERLSLHIIDTIKVQCAFRGQPESPKNIRVLKVLEFNGEVLSEPLEDNALRSILGSYSVSSDGQRDLFDG